MEEKNKRNKIRKQKEFNTIIERYVLQRITNFYPNKYHVFNGILLQEIMKDYLFNQLQQYPLKQIQLKEEDYNDIQSEEEKQQPNYFNQFFTLNTINQFNKNTNTNELNQIENKEEINERKETKAIFSFSSTTSSPSHSQSNSNTNSKFNSYFNSDESEEEILSQEK